MRPVVPYSPAFDTTKFAACCAFSEYVRCGGKIKSPCRQMSSPTWQMIRTFELGTLPTASPSSGSPKICILSARFQHRRARSREYAKGLKTYHDRVDECRLRGRELQGSLVHHLPSLGIPRHHKLGVRALRLRPFDEGGKGSGSGWIAAFVEPSYIRSVVDLSQNRAGISNDPFAHRGLDSLGVRHTPCTATLLAPTLPTTAWKKGGPARVPTLPDSVVPRAKRMVMARQGVPSVS